MTAMRQPVLCVVHAPKTAGTAIRATLGAILGMEKVYWVGHDRPASHWETASGTEFGDYLVVGGHVSAAQLAKIQRPKVFMAVVREPVRQAISLFDFITRGAQSCHPLREELHGLSLIEALGRSRAFRDEVSNCQCRMIGEASTFSAALRSMCEREWFVDRYECVDELLARVCNKFGWPSAALSFENVNPTRRYFEDYCSKDIFAALKNINHADTVLYHALNHREDSR